MSQREIQVCIYLGMYVQTNMQFEERAIEGESYRGREL